MNGPWFALKRGVLKHVNAWRGRAVFIHINKTGGTSIEYALHLRSERKTALEKRRELGAERFAAAFKFAFVRNPWDKVVSHYHYRVRTGRIHRATYGGSGGDPDIAFRDWVLRAYGERDPAYFNDARPFMAQWQWLCDEEGRCMVDYVGRFERLAEDFAQVAARLGVEARLPHAKPGAHGHYRGYYDDETRAVIAERFARDLEAFGYRF